MMIRPFAFNESKQLRASFVCSSSGICSNTAKSVIASNFLIGSLTPGNRPLKSLKFSPLTSFSRFGSTPMPYLIFPLFLKRIPSSLPISRYHASRFNKFDRPSLFFGFASIYLTTALGFLFILRMLKKKLEKITCTPKSMKAAAGITNLNV